MYETLSYYLRLLGDVDIFLSRYLDAVETDGELTYDHRKAWNDFFATAG